MHVLFCLGRGYTAAQGADEHSAARRHDKWLQLLSEIAPGLKRPQSCSIPAEQEDRRADEGGAGCGEGSRCELGPPGATKALALKAEGQARAEALRPVFEGLRDLGHRAAARALNDRGIRTAAGNEWTAMQVTRVRKRLTSR